MTDNNALQNVHGTIALAGAGKMGGAMLAGWIGSGVAPSRIAVIEPMPSPDIRALMAQVYLAGWFALVLGGAFIVQYVVRRVRAGAHRQ